MRKKKTPFSFVINKTHLKGKLDLYKLFDIIKTTDANTKREIVFKLLQYSVKILHPNADIKAITKIYRSVKKQIKKRGYHNVNHIFDVILVAVFIVLKAALSGSHRERKFLSSKNKQAKFILAAFFHDSVYIAGSDKNEEESAKLARCLLSYVGIDDTHILEIQEAILLTKHPVKIKRSNTTYIGKLLHDADLAMLAKPYDSFVDDRFKIKEELGLSDEEFFAGSKKFFLQFLEQDKMFMTPYGRFLFEEHARRNLQRFTTNMQAG